LERPSPLALFGSSVTLGDALVSRFAKRVKER
jgi:hypothetical protein